MFSSYGLSIAFSLSIGAYLIVFSDVLEDDQYFGPFLLFVVFSFLAVVPGVNVIVFTAMLLFVERDRVRQWLSR